MGCIVVVLAVLFSIHTLTSVHQDIGRHLALGKIIWETHQVPTTNLFSYTASDFPFINHHWLSEVFLYGLYLMGGLTGLIVAKALLCGLVFLLVFFTWYRSDGVWVAASAGVLSLFIFIERTDVRPEIVSFLFLAWFLFVLVGQRDRLLWTLPVVQLLWVNSHIYFFMGPMMLACALLAEYFQSREIGIRFKKLSWITLASLGALFINPFFWRGALYPLFIFSNYGYSIVENKSPFFLQDFGYPQFTTTMLFVGMGLVALSFALNYKNIRNNVFGLLLSFITAVFSLIMIRNYPLFALVLVPVVAKNFYEYGMRDTRARSIGFVLAALLLMFSITDNQFYAQAGLGRRFGLEVPRGAEGAIQFVRDHKLRRPMFNNFDIGSYLIWKLPEEKVFIDGRPEAYPDNFIQDIYIKMQEDPVAWEKYSKEYNIKLIFWAYTDITPWSQTFLQRIQKDPTWEEVYRGEGVILFVPRK